MTNRKYLLDGRKVVACNDLTEWATWFEGFEGEERIVEQTMVNDVLVSTVFLGLDHNFEFGEDGPPVLFETMIFDDKQDQVWRYSTWDEASEGHQTVVELYKGQQKQLKEAAI